MTRREVFGFSLLPSESPSEPDLVFHEIRFQSGKSSKMQQCLYQTQSFYSKYRVNGKKVPGQQIYAIEVLRKAINLCWFALSLSSHTSLMAQVKSQLSFLSPSVCFSLYLSLSVCLSLSRETHTTQYFNFQVIQMMGHKVFLSDSLFTWDVGMFAVASTTKRLQNKVQK